MVKRVQGVEVTSAEVRAEQEHLAKNEKLSVFRRLAEDGKSKKSLKAKRQELMEKTFPSSVNLDWGVALSNDDDLFVRIMRDIIKLDQRQPGRSGPRPNNLDHDKALATFRQLMGEDFSTLPFIDAFALLTRGFSRTQVARKTHLSRTKIQRLLTGEYTPNEYDLRAIADGFHKHPSYFVEYRRQYIIDHLAEQLLKEPESTIAYYQKILRVQ